MIWELPPTPNSPLSSALPQWRHLLRPSERHSFGSGYNAMNMLILSAYFITTVWDHCVLLSLSLHGTTKNHVVFYTSICLPHCPHRNRHLWGLPKFYILGQLLLKNKKRKNKQKKYLYYEQNKPSLARTPSPPESCTSTFRATSDSGQKNSSLRLTSLQCGLLPPHKVNRVRNLLDDLWFGLINLISCQDCQLSEFWNFFF